MVSPSWRNCRQQMSITFTNPNPLHCGAPKMTTEDQVNAKLRGVADALEGMKVGTAALQGHAPGPLYAIASGMWENDEGPEDWHAVASETQGIVAYFQQ